MAKRVLAPCCRSFYLTVANWKPNLFNIHNIHRMPQNSMQLTGRSKSLIYCTQDSQKSSFNIHAWMPNLITQNSLVFELWTSGVSNCRYRSEPLCDELQCDHWHSGPGTRPSGGSCSPRVQPRWDPRRSGPCPTTWGGHGDCLQRGECRRLTSLLFLWGGGWRSLALFQHWWAGLLPCTGLAHHNTGGRVGGAWWRGHKRDGPGGLYPTWVPWPCRTGFVSWH